MPKKTKHEKILAKERRLKLLQKLYSSETSAQTVHVKKQSISLSHATVTKSLSQEREDDLKARRYFLSDFKRSLAFITFVIALEIAVYFGTINNYLKF